ncbi:MAG: hypothetical protein CXZ00_14505 [Acidobacteria bacterium]|nr:MAG: hypothetical protein CXZ00_14505 [Acidobacteriota bacterium]
MEADMTAVEKRKMRRFALQLPLTLTAAAGESLESRATTLDISSHGVCFSCDCEMKPDSDIEFILTLPAEVTMTESIDVHCRGTVVRVGGEGTDGKFAIAVAINSYEFVPADETEFVGYSSVEGSGL